MRIMITGASGKLGQEVLLLLPEATALARKSSGVQFPKELVVDFENPESLKSALSDCDVLIHLAGSMNFQSRKELYGSNVLLTKKILAALPQKTKVIYASSISIYGKNPPRIVDESTPPDPDTPYARSKYEAEKLVMQRRNSISLRIGAMYGPQYPDYARILKMIRKGRMPIIGNGANPVSFVHVSDVATAVANAVQASPGVYVLAGKSIPQEEIYSIAARILNVPPPKSKIPLALALFLARLEEMRASILGKKPLITTEHINILAKGRSFDCSKARTELGFRPRKLEEGIEEIVKSMA
ncbi:MAG: NAD-dependent epimerase/dehydratase family protein [Candidatus ainarchaeum sp.]|nr:NAD-dependent epimerase/dehydratase family protein [Candidatus ainarchaeum sp.]